MPRAPTSPRRLRPGAGRRDPSYRSGFVFERPRTSLSASIGYEVIGTRDTPLKRLENRADDGLGEFGAEAVEPGCFLGEERGRIDRRVSGRGGVVLLPDGDAGVLPEQLVLADVAELDV